MLQIGVFILSMIPSLPYIVGLNYYKLWLEPFLNSGVYVPNKPAASSFRPTGCYMVLRVRLTSSYFLKLSTTFLVIKMSLTAHAFAVGHAPRVLAIAALTVPREAIRG